MGMSAEIEMLREAYEALNSGEWERSPDFMHDEITWNFVEGAAPDAPQTLSGVSEIIDFWGFFFTAWEEWEMAPREFARPLAVRSWPPFTSTPAARGAAFRWISTSGR